MLRLTAVLLLTIICSCSTNNKNLPKGIEVIPVDLEHVAKEASSFLEKIEIVPLETNDSSLLHRCNKVIYDKDMDLYFIYTSDQIVYTFTGSGKYIANSKKMKGRGPEEYFMALDINVNPYLQGIDMLNPYGTIYTYSPTYELIQKRKIEPEFPIDFLMALDSVNYIFNHPFLWTDQELTFVNLKTNQSTGAYYQGTISSGNNMSHHCFYHIGDNFYYVPFGLNYYIYKINVNEKKLEPMMYLDFGDYEVKSEGLPGCATGKRTDSDEERRRISDGATERYQYLRNSTNILPLLKFFNDDYVYAYLAKTSIGYGSHYIYNRNSKESYLCKEGEPLIMYPCFGIEDNALLSICNPEYVPKVVDSKIMSQEEIEKMEALKEDDNPVIVKYYLKK